MQHARDNRPASESSIPILEIEHVQQWFADHTAPDGAHAACDEWPDEYLELGGES